MAYMTLAASVGGGSATFTETGSHTAGDTSSSTLFTTYQFVATGTAEWQFSRWEHRSRYQQYTSSGGTGSWSAWSNWGAESYSSTFSKEYTCAQTYDYGFASGGTNYEHEVRAVFEQRAFNVGVYVSTDSPQNSGSVSGGGTYAQYASCTVTATANTGFEFVKWTTADSSSAAAVSTSASYTFTVTASVTLYAHFKRAATGKLLYGSGGRLLHGSAGTLLYDGD
ncbi:MAG: hypothetical protein IJL17_02190 [Kiritimatiellae bacterium]|nr:hypothetical protein [Kiritimatiellia bacterium]